MAGQKKNLRKIGNGNILRSTWPMEFSRGKAKSCQTKLTWELGTISHARFRASTKGIWKQRKSSNVRPHVIKIKHRNTMLLSQVHKATMSSKCYIKATDPQEEEEEEEKKVLPGSKLQRWCTLISKRKQVCQKKKNVKVEDRSHIAPEAQPPKRKTLSHVSIPKKYSKNQALY